MLPALVFAAIALYPSGVFAHPTGHDIVDSAPADAADLAAGSSEFEVLSRQIAQLQRQVREHDERVRLRDILGAIGYILGLTGLAFYFLGVRRKERDSGPRKP